MLLFVYRMTLMFKLVLLWLFNSVLCCSAVVLKYYLIQTCMLALG